MQIDWKDLFLNMNGRIGRQAFWIGFVIILVASFLVNLIPVIGQLVGLALLWPQIAIHAKRLHDMGRTAWLILAPFVISIVSLVLATVTGGATVLAAMTTGDSTALAQAAGGLGLTLLFVVVALGAGLAFLLWVGLSRGDPDANRFGPPPRTP